MKLRTLVFVNKIDSAFNFPLMKSYTANKIKTQYLKPLLCVNHSTTPPWWKPTILYRPVPANKPHGLTASGPLGVLWPGRCSAGPWLGKARDSSRRHTALWRRRRTASRSTWSHGSWSPSPHNLACSASPRWQLWSMLGRRAGDKCRDHSWPPTRALHHYGLSSPLRPHKCWLTLFHFGRLCVFLLVCFCNVVQIFIQYILYIFRCIVNEDVLYM